MSEIRQAFHGTIIHIRKLGEIEIDENTLLIIGRDGCIKSMRPRIPAEAVPETLKSLGCRPDFSVRYLSQYEFLIPGFVDTHNHAPQFAQRGLGQNLHILDWLDQLTFPNEAKFADTTYARRVYSRCVDGFIKQGITCASYYGSLHGPATQILAEICLEKGQRALVGKCNMNSNSPSYYMEESAEESLQATQDFIDHVGALDQHWTMIRPILTPRFAISCDAPLLMGLGKLAARYPNIPIQTHFNEAQQEIDATRQLFSGFGNEADLYEHFGLLNNRSILAHCTIMTKYELDKLESLDCGVAHCPIANTTVGGGFMAAPIREFLRRGIKVGLGTDSGGGFSSSILDAMRQAMIVSNSREATDGSKALTIAELFYLATIGGAQVCGLGERIGNFETGKQFDALVIRGHGETSDAGLDQGVMTMVEPGDSLYTIFEKFILTGDDRNIVEVFVRGRQLKPAPK